MASYRSPISCAAWLSLALLGTSCGGGIGGDASDTDAISSALVGAAGASLVGPEGSSVVVPADALTSDVTIVVSALGARRTPAGTSAVGAAMRLEPAGTTFDKPVEVTIPISPSSLGGASLDDVVVIRADQGSSVFVPLPTRRSSNGSSVVAITEHFSDFVPVLITGASPFGACGDSMCVGGESCGSCPADCGVCVPANVCGNGTCEPNASESCSTCAFDCGTCASQVCGDGILDPNETCDSGMIGGTALERCFCDDANPCTDDTMISGSMGTCNVLCAHAPMLGYGLSHCDDNVACTFDAITGSSPVVCALTCANVAMSSQQWGAMVCDDADPCTIDDALGYNPQGCTSESCSHFQIPGCVTVCGDGLVSGTEVCDDANINSSDGCASDCLSIDANFMCPPGGGACWNCGNGTLEGPESCDEGISRDDIGCVSNCLAKDPSYDCSMVGLACTFIQPCGNSVLNGGEQCDDGNATMSDGCDASCQIESGYSCPTVGVLCYLGVCGNGSVEGPELCDDNNTANNDGCISTCLGILPGYTCLATGSPCFTTCGDGVGAGLEGCDDGNTGSLDGCDGSCQVEANYTCPPTGGSCTFMSPAGCGDGSVTGVETCDDANVLGSDGCSATCDVEVGWVCMVPAQPCFTVCGDGVTAGPESCDAGASNGMYGAPCNATCNGPAPFCGDGIWDMPPEACDDGPGGVCLDDCSG